MTKYSREELIAIGRRWIDHAPNPGDTADGLWGFKGGICVCSRCSSRIIRRGCDISMLASDPVWTDLADNVTCDLCGWSK